MLKALENQIYKDCKKKTHGRDKRSELIRNALDEVYTDHRKRLVLQIKEAKKIVGKLAIEFNTTFPGEELGEMLDYYEEEED